MYNSIIVGYDESESSKAALKEAALRIKQRGGKLTLIHAVYFDEEEFAIMPGQMEQRLEAGAHICRVAKKTLSAEFGLNGSVESIVCQGEPPDVLVEIAREKKADLIALGTYGRKGLKRLLMGSVVSQVILIAPCDVLVVKKPCKHCTGDYHSLLVPFDGSETSKRVLKRACEISTSEKSEITVLYVIPRYEEMMDFFKTEAIRNSLLREAGKIMDAAKKIAQDAGVSIETIVDEGRAGDKIAEAAGSRLSDLIVMGTHGWQGVDKAIMGSTTERVVSNANCPILIVK